MKKVLKWLSLAMCWFLPFVACANKTDAEIREAFRLAGILVGEERFYSIDRDHFYKWVEHPLTDYERGSIIKSCGERQYVSDAKLRSQVLMGSYGSCDSKVCAALHLLYLKQFNPKNTFKNDIENLPYVQQRLAMQNPSSYKQHKKSFIEASRLGFTCTPHELKSIGLKEDKFGRVSRAKKLADSSYLSNEIFAYNCHIELKQLVSNINFWLRQLQAYAPPSSVPRIDISYNDPRINIVTRLKAAKTEAQKVKSSAMYYIRQAAVEEERHQELMNKLNDLEDLLNSRGYYY